MFIFKNAKTFINFLNNKINAQFNVDFVNNHVGYIVLKNKKIVGKVELADKIYLDLNNNYL